MNFSRGQTKTKILCESCLLPGRLLILVFSVLVPLLLCLFCFFCLTPHWTASICSQEDRCGCSVFSPSPSPTRCARQVGPCLISLVLVTNVGNCNATEASLATLVAKQVVAFDTPLALFLLGTLRIPFGAVWPPPEFYSVSSCSLVNFMAASNEHAFWPSGK